MAFASSMTMTMPDMLIEDHSARLSTARQNRDRKLTQEAKILYNNMVGNGFQDSQAAALRDAQ